jgi:NitT/TauT family transport system permease protein
MRSTSATSATLKNDSQASRDHDQQADLAFIAAKKRRALRHRVLVYILRVLVLVVVIGAWQIAAHERWLDPFFFGEPSGIVTQLHSWIVHGTAQGSLITQIDVTVKETVYGFIIGVVLGVGLGILLARVKIVNDVVGPYIKVFNSFPRIVFGSILTIWLGLGSASKVWLAVILVFFVVFFNAYQGVREADRGLVSNARLLGANRWRVLWDVILPSALSWIITSLHVALGFALIGAIVGEFLGASQGLGLLIATAQSTFNPNGVFAAMLILAVLALVIEGLMTLLERSLLKWRPPSQQGQ